MRVSIRARACAMAFAAGGLLLVPLAVPAGAASQPASCGKLSTKTVGKNIVVTQAQCTPLAATGGSGSGTEAAPKSGTNKGKIITTITWVKNHGTTKSTVSFAPNKAGPGKCATGTTRLTISGKVISATGTIATIVKVGQLTTGSVCLKGTSASLEPGTRLKF